MTKLNFRAILDSYESRVANSIDKGEHIDCAGCGRRFTEPGTMSVGCMRKPNQPSNLPMSIELCEGCAKSVEAFKP
jgi:hypothetical protein